MSFKKGDKVKVVSSKETYWYKPGETYTLTSVYDTHKDWGIIWSIKEHPFNKLRQIDIVLATKLEQVLK